MLSSSLHAGETWAPRTTRRTPASSTTERPADPAASRLADLQSLLDAERDHPEHWRPEERPAALPCFLTTYHQGKPALGTAVVDAEATFDPDLPLEVVPPAEVQRHATRLLTKGGHYIFSDDYVQRHPESEVARMIQAYQQQLLCSAQGGEEGDSGTSKGLVVAKTASEADENGLSSAGVSTTTTATASGGNTSLTSTGTGPSSAFSSVTGMPKTKKEQVRECIQEVARANWPIFRPRDPTLVYGKATYVKRNFHEIMDQEYPIEYFI